MEFDKENLSKLSNDELFKAMKKCGLSVGPITATTRSVYEKKLRNYLESAPSKETAATATTTAESVLSATATATVAKTSLPLNPVVNGTPTKAKESIKIVSSSSLAGGDAMTTRSDLAKKRVEDSTDEAKKRAEELPTAKITIERASQPSAVKQITINHSVGEEIYPSRPQMAPSESAASKSERENVRKADLTEFRLLKPSMLNATFDEAVAATSVRTNPRVDSLNRTTVISSTSSSPGVDKFAERLKNYGLLRNDADTSVAGTPTSLRTRATTSTAAAAANVESSWSRDRHESPLKHSQPAASLSAQKPTTSTANPAAAATAKSSMLNWKYLLSVCVVTALVYFLIIHFQANPDNPVEF